MFPKVLYYKDEIKIEETYTQIILKKSSHDCNCSNFIYSFPQKLLKQSTFETYRKGILR